MCSLRSLFPSNHVPSARSGVDRRAPFPASALGADRSSRRIVRKGRGFAAPAGEYSWAVVRVLPVHLPGMTGRGAPNPGKRTDAGGDGARGSEGVVESSGDQVGGPLDAGSWPRHLEGANCASLLVVIRARLGPGLLARLQPEDILQESLLQAWRDRDGAEFQSPRAFRAWLLTIIDHRIRDAAERATALKRGGSAGVASMLAEGPGGLEPLGSATPSRVAVYREQAAVMSEALQGVPTEWREVVHLRLFHQFTLNQIAEQLGMSLAMVRTRLRRGAEVYRQRLRAGGIGRSTFRSTTTSALHGTDPASVV